MSKVCYTWGNAGILWKDANWEWDDCQTVAQCFTWGDANVLWMNANWFWSMCSGSIPPTPPTASVASGSIQPLGIDATTLIQPWLVEPWNPYRAGELEKQKKRKFIKLICKVKGQTFEEEKEVEKYDVTVDDVKMVVKAMTNIDLDIKKLEE